MTAREQLKYLQYTFIQKLRELDANTAPKFGKMNPQQMVEHMTYAIHLAKGDIKVTAINTDENLEKAYRWMMSDAPFKDNTTNQLLPEEPIACAEPSMGDAIDSLEDALEAFVASYKGEGVEAGRRVLHPMFGELSYYEQVHLLHKHAQHHARQFGA
jgi:DinB superfamily